TQMRSKSESVIVLVELLAVAPQPQEHQSQEVGKGWLVTVLVEKHPRGLFSPRALAPAPQPAPHRPREVKLRRPLDKAPSGVGRELPQRRQGKAFPDLTGLKQVYHPGLTTQHDRNPTDHGKWSGFTVQEPGFDFCTSSIEGLEAQRAVGVRA